MSVVDQKRIAKNTLLLYLRMGVIMLIGFYTSRVVLATLGEVDFGLYNVIGGIVVAFAFLNGVMSAACNRYFAIEIGREDYDALKKVFSLNVTIFLVLGGIILLLSETVGLWFLNAKMVIPPDRHDAANWVYQFSVLAFLVNMMSTPYRAIIVAKEKMKVFAYSSIVEAVLRLLIVFLLPICPYDQLIFYGILMFSISLAVSGFYFVYCTRFYPECRYTYYWDKPLFKEIVGYTGWQVIGGMAGIGRSQGLNIILNMFFGPVVNAARGVAYQVYVNIYQFVNNFAMAYNPQIFKSYATNEHQAMQNLVFRSSKFSYYLLFLFVLPVFIEAPAILDIWLKDVPTHAVLFCRLMLIIGLIDCIGIPLGTAVSATGKIMWYQITIGGVQLLAVVAAYVMFKFGTFPPETVFFLSIASSVISLFLRVFFIFKQLQMSVIKYLKNVLLPIIFVTILSGIVPCLIALYAPSSLLWSCVSILSGFGFVILLVYTLGITPNERIHLKNLIRQKLTGIHNPPDIPSND